jgi:trehalose 6-phosphate synthase/phosphatase
MPRMLAHFVKEELAGKRLIVISNREPYIHKRTGLSVKVERPAGGLTSALDDMLQATGGTWVAWGSGNADRDAVDADDRVAVPVGQPAYTLKRVWLGTAEVENYYHGYSNQVLWPLCHITLDRVTFRKKYWEDYLKVNRAFAAAALEEAGEHSLIWIHDYHLCLVPRFVREKNPDAVLAHFWHIPWPDWSVFRVCPQAREIMEGLLGNDLIGFQIPLFVKNFMDCVKECLDAEIDERRGTVTWNDRVTTLKAFPISIDYEKFNAMASSKRVAAAMQDIKERYQLPESTGIGVDRLEYTKALIKRLQAIALFFERFEKMRGRFTFVQIAVPTRMKEPYLSYKKAVEDLIARINGKYARKSWKPVVYIDAKIEHRDLVAYYRLADVAVISSIYDGMNLVAKEYAASQADEKGVLILSELAGAADELEGAILVNPYDIEEFSASIRRALVMPREEKKRRMTALRRHIRENDIYKWIRVFLAELNGHWGRKQNRCLYFPDYEPRFSADVGGRKIFLFLDYDGTLAPIADSPEKAVIPHSTYTLVEKLAGLAPVAIVSGRSVEDIQERLPLAGVVYAGNHGAEIRSGDKVLVSGRSERDRALLEEMLERMRRSLAPFAGVLIEDKGVTASVHYRKVDLKHLADLALLFHGISREYEKSFRITSGKKVFEIRPLAAWNKGDAVAWIADNLGTGTVPVYIGDDVTDEDAFRALKGRGLSISVGGSAYADYYVRRQEEVDLLLERLVAMEGG